MDIFIISMGFMVPAEIAWDPEQNKNVIVSIGEPQEVEINSGDIYVVDGLIHPLTRLPELEKIILVAESDFAFETFQDNISPQVPFTQDVCSSCSVKQVAELCRGPPKQRAAV